MSNEMELSMVPERIRPKPEPNFPSGSGSGISYVDRDPLDPYYGRLAGSGSVWRDTDPDRGHINVQNNAMAKEFCVNKLIIVDFFHQV